MNFTDIENEIKNFYEMLWSDPGKINRSGSALLLGWHYGFYEKGIKTVKEAMINMNDYVGRLLELNNDTAMNILDAGSGVGSTSIHLAKKYPNCAFHGITLTANELKIAKSLQKTNLISNIKFKQGSYMKSGYPDNYFDRIFALESVIYAPNKREFLQEMQRILKPNGKLVIIDTFLKIILNSLTINIDNYLHQRKYSQSYLKKYYMSVYSFVSCLKSEKFEGINVHDLVSSGNVKRSHIYVFLIYRLFSSPPSKFKKIGEMKKTNSIKNSLMYPFVFSTLFIYKLLLVFCTRPGYYSIEARKK